jgi:NADPH-dependent ferric siderophore reductase/DNA-binding NarL/FixJ family response regulator
VTIRVVVADDQVLVRAGFRVLVDSAPDLEVVGEAGDGVEAVELAHRERPHVVLMDIRMPTMDGLDATRRITADAATAGVRVLVLTTFDLDEYVYEALRAGASGFLLKDTPPADLLTAVRVVAAGDALLAPRVTRRLIEEFARRPRPHRVTPAALDVLTEREREVLALVARGLSNADIAEQLYVSPATAKTHVSRLLMKLQARDRAQLVMLAYETGLVTPGRRDGQRGRAVVSSSRDGPGGAGEPGRPRGRRRLALGAPSRMSGSERARTPLRREPPRFRQVAVRRVEHLSPRLVRVTLAGSELEGLVVEQPAASVRVLLPSPGARELVVPTWNGNEFLLPDGRRPAIRTFTPRRVDAEALELDVEIVIHGGGMASEWAEAARPGDPAAVSGPGRGYAIDLDAPAFLLAGDETAVPAINQLLESLPAERPVQVHVEVAHPDARLPLPDHPGATVEWYDLPAGAAPGDALVAAVGGADIGSGTRVWVAGEAAAVQRIRRRLFEDRGLPRAQATVRGYWKHGRSGDADDEA